jgi:hypothetical protein
MRIGESVECLFCLAPRGAGLTLKLDKHQKPYLKCESCGSMVFLRGGNQALRGPTMLWGPLNRALQASDGEAGRAILEETVGQNAARSAKEVYSDAVRNQPK